MTDLEILKIIVDQLISIEDSHHMLMASALKELQFRVENMNKRDEIK